MRWRDGPAPAPSHDWEWGIWTRLLCWAGWHRIYLSSRCAVCSKPHHDNERFKIGLCYAALIASWILYICVWANFMGFFA